jgi:hypothetical protein
MHTFCRSLTGRAAPNRVGAVTRALAVLTCAAFVALVAEATVADHPILAISLAAVFSAVAVVGYGWIDRQPPSRRRAPAVAYVAVQLALGYLIFGAVGTGVGATLLLMVLVSQSVLLLPLPTAGVTASGTSSATTSRWSWRCWSGWSRSAPSSSWRGPP